LAKKNALPMKIDFENQKGIQKNEIKNNDLNLNLK
jgi:hypothetical protein